MLARKLIPWVRRTEIPKIRRKNGTLTQNPQTVMNLFHDYYSSLYGVQENVSTGAMNDFIKDLALPSLSTSHREILEGGITIEEVLQVIKQAKTSKTPGPDGFSTAYYKKFAIQLAPHLLWFFMAIWDGTALDTASNKANICLIPKPNKDHTDVAKYCPISLINNDLKLLTKIYVNRFNSILTQYIHRPGRICSG